MKQKIIFCILLMLLSSVDVALAKGKKKKARKVQRTEMYEEIDNFDFLYSNDYDVNMSFASTDDILSQATSFIGTRYRLGNRDHTPSTARASPVMSMVRTTSRLVVPPVTSMPATSPSARRRCSPAAMVFFTSPHSGRGVGHVGIIMDYNPIDNSFTFIHASSKGGVKISHSTDGNYMRRYIGVRRVAK